MKKLIAAMCLSLSVNLFSFEEIKGIGERKCGAAIKKGVTPPQFATYKMNCETFEHVIGSWYKDKENVYFYKDNNSMYIGFEVIDGINPETVKPLGEKSQIYYMSDGKNIYIQRGFYMDGIIENANIKKFEILENGYSKDNKKVYYLSKELKNFDIKTFRSYPEMIRSSVEYNAKDKNNYYRDGRIVKLK